MVGRGGWFRVVVGLGGLCHEVVVGRGGSRFDVVEGLGELPLEVVVGFDWSTSNFVWTLCGSREGAGADGVPPLPLPEAVGNAPGKLGAKSGTGAPSLCPEPSKAREGRFGGGL